ncbi:MAG: hypothetical protein VKP62_08620 [Candidatus Sericytochromatia bacterium]|nr:hypothetical protein [Candidatus Sericytochromatia bacterium]
MRHHLVGILLLPLLAGCGWYTNLPASLYVASVKPGKVIYEPPNTAGVRDIKTENPVVRFQGEPGSIGALFNSVSVKYLLGSGKPASPDRLPGVSFGLSFRVEASTYPAPPAGGKMDQSQLGLFIEPGKTEIELPVLTRHVEQFGLDTSQPEGNAPLVTADTTFTGLDDANFPITLQAFVPIYFSGNPGSK